MEVTFVKMLRNIDGYGIVEVQTPFGRAICLWKSRNAPTPNTSYEIEVEIRDQLVWGRDLKKCDTSTEMSFESTEEKSSFKGMLEAVYEDGVCAIRVGDNLILVQTQGPAVELGSLVVGTTGHSAVLYDSGT